MFRKHITVRQMFEARFPAPFYVKWDGKRYVAEVSAFDYQLAREHTSKYVGFVACYKMAAGIETINQYKFCRFWK